MARPKIDPNDETAKVSLRVPTALLARFDKVAAERGVERSTLLRSLMQGVAVGRRPATRTDDF